MTRFRFPSPNKKCALNSKELLLSSLKEPWKTAKFEKKKSIWNLGIKTRSPSSLLYNLGTSRLWKSKIRIWAKLVMSWRRLSKSGRTSIQKLTARKKRQKRLSKKKPRKNYVLYAWKLKRMLYSFLVDTCNAAWPVPREPRMKRDSVQCAGTESSQ